jgi:hypothetical protein
VFYVLFLFLQMLSRSTSFTSSTEPANENVKSTTSVRHHESLQNLRQARPMLSRPLNIENNNKHNLPTIPQNIKRTTAGTILTSTQNILTHLINNENKHEQHIDIIKRTIVQDDIENIHERLNEMLITAPIANDHETSLLPPEQASTTEYFTPKISLDENGKKKLDEHGSQLNDEENQTNDDDDADLYRK